MSIQDNINNSIQTAGIASVGIGMNNTKYKEKQAIKEQKKFNESVKNDFSNIENNIKANTGPVLYDAIYARKNEEIEQMRQQYQDQRTALHARKDLLNNKQYDFNKAIIENRSTADFDKTVAKDRSYLKGQHSKLVSTYGSDLKGNPVNAENKRLIYNKNDALLYENALAIDNPSELNNIYNKQNQKNADYLSKENGDENV